MLMNVLSLLVTAHQAAPSAWRTGGVEHDAIPAAAVRGRWWNDTARIRLAVSEVQSA
jgi:hypothetical protein